MKGALAVSFARHTLMQQANCDPDFTPLYTGKSIHFSTTISPILYQDECMIAKQNDRGDLAGAAF